MGKRGNRVLDESHTWLIMILTPFDSTLSNTKNGQANVVHRRDLIQKGTT